MKNLILSQCGHCNNQYTFKNNKRKFCSSSCSAKYNNSIRDNSIRIKQRNTLLKTLSNKSTIKKVKKEKIKTTKINKHVIRTLPTKLSALKKDKKYISKITGQTYCNNLHKNTWHSNFKFRQAQKLSKMFNFELCKEGTEQNLINAVKTLHDLYHVEKISPNKIAEHINCSNKNFSNFLESIGIKRRSIKESLLNYNRSIGRELTSEKDIYYKNCQFKFDVFKHTKILGYELFKEHTWYHPINNVNGLTRDHMMSISYGYEHGIDPEMISHPANCQIMLALDNFKKNYKTSITYEQLKERIENWNTNFKSDIILVQTKRNRSKHTKDTKDKLKKANLGKKWYNNGITNIVIKPGETIPDGYVKGLIISNNKKRANSAINNINWNNVQIDINSGFGMKDICARNNINRDQYYGGLLRKFIIK